MGDRILRRESKGFATDAWHTLTFAAMAFGLMVLALSTVRGLLALEARFYPVMVDFKPGEYAAADGGTLFSGGAIKRRDCDWHRTIVYLGSRQGRKVVATDKPHRDGPQIRPTGELHWDRIFVPVPPDQMGETFADALHDCGWWRPYARSRFWENAE